MKDKRTAMWKKALSCALAVTLCGRPESLSADELSDLKWLIHKHYEHMIPHFRSIAQRSPELAKGYTVAIFNELRQAATGSFAKLHGEYSPKLSDLGKCMANLRLISDQLEPVIAAEPADAKARDAYRRQNYTVDTFSKLTDLIFATQKNYSNCIFLVEDLGDSLQALAKVPEETKLCTDHIKKIEYSAMLDQKGFQHKARAKVDGSFLAQVPTLKLTFTTSTGCGDHQEGCDNEEVSVEGEDAETANQKSERNRSVYGNSAVVAGAASAAIKAYPWLVGSTAAGAQTAAMGYGALIAIVYIIVTYAIVTTEMSLRVKDLKKFVREQDQEIAKIMKHEFISLADFEKLKAAVCRDGDQEFAKELAANVAKVEIDKHLAGIAWFRHESDRLVDWYNDLFLWASEGVSGQRFIDSAAVAAFQDKQAQFFEATYRAAALQEKNLILHDIAKAQADISLHDCNPGAEGRRTSERTLNEKMRRFERVCAVTLEATSLETEALAFANPTLPPTVICRYTGTLELNAKVVVKPNADFTSSVAVIDSHGNVLANLPRLDSETAPVSDSRLPGFSCESDAFNAFGISPENRLAPGEYPLETPANTRGLADSDAKELKIALANANATVEKKLQRCEIATSQPRDADLCKP